MVCRSSVSYSLLFFAVLVLTLLVYWPGLNGIFLVDDVYNLNTLNANGGVTDWPSLLSFVFENNSGMLGRPVSMLSFLIDDQYYPGSVESYRYTNLMIHCLCGVFLFVLTRQLAGVITNKGDSVALSIAILVTAWWLLAPLNVSTTLYIIQRMTQLAALFCLVGLCLFIYGRQLVDSEPIRGRIYAALGIYLFGGLAVLSKENGALIFCFALVLELAVSYGQNRRSDRYILALVLVPLALGVCFFLLKFGSFTRSSVRDFTTVERLMTEARILWDYAGKIVLPVSGKMGLVHDDVVISRGLFSPLSTVISILAHVVLVVVAIFYRKRHIWLFIAVFGFYAGHLLESTVIPLELYFEHRNYMPAIFVYIGLVGLCWNLVAGKAIARTLLVLCILASAAVCLQRAEIWGNPKAQIFIWAQEHPESVRAQTMYARSLIAEKRYDAAEREINRLQVKWPHFVHNDLVVLNQACVGNMSLNYSLDELYNRMDNGVYDGSLPSVLEETFRLYTIGRCELIDNALMGVLLDKAMLLDKAAQTFKAKVAFWKVEFHARNGYLTGAIDGLDEVFKYQKDSYALFLKSAMFHDAGLHELALVEVNKAIVMEEQKRKMLRIHIGSYARLRERIITALEKGQH